MAQFKPQIALQYNPCLHRASFPTSCSIRCTKPYHLLKKNLTYLFFSPNFSFFFSLVSTFYLLFSFFSVSLSSVCASTFVLRQFVLLFPSHIRRGDKRSDSKIAFCIPPLRRKLQFASSAQTFRFASRFVKVLFQIHFFDHLVHSCREATKFFK